MQSQLSRNFLRLRSSEVKRINFYSILAVNSSNIKPNKTPNLKQHHPYSLILNNSLLSSLNQNQSLRNLSLTSIVRQQAANDPIEVNTSAESAVDSTAFAEESSTSIAADIVDSVTSNAVDTAESTVLASADNVATDAITNTAADAVTNTATDAVTNTTVNAVTSSTATADSKELILDFIPEKPLPIDPTTIIGEPSFESLGLGSWWPSGRLQLVMEFLHVDIGLEWYQTIALTALTLRLMTLPFVIMSQKNVAHMTAHSPVMAELQEKMTDARKRGDQMEMYQAGQDLQDYMNKNKISPFKNMIPVLIQMPIFLSMFFGLRGMSNVPVPSMEEGGVLWFENLTMMDPFYGLPLLTTATLFLQFRFGVDGMRFEQMGPVAKGMMMGLPFVMFPITMNFASSLTFYWFVTNTIAIVQTRSLKLPAIRKKLNIPEVDMAQVQKVSSKKKKGFQGVRESLSDTIANFKTQADNIDKRAMDEKAFQEAGTKKPIKTYTYDPTKPVAIKYKKKSQY